MFGFLKKKIAEAVESVSGKLKKKEAEEQKPPEAPQQPVEEPKAELPPIEHHLEKLETGTAGETEAPKVEEVAPAPEAEEEQIVANEPEPEKRAEPEPVKEFFEGKFEELEKEVETITESPKQEEKVEPQIPVVTEEKEEKIEEPVTIEERVETEIQRVEPPEIKIEDKIETKVTEAVEEPQKKSFFKKITEKVVKRVTEKKLSQEDVDPILTNLETSLIESDVAVEVAEKIKNDLRTALVDREIKRGKEKEVVTESIRKSLTEILDVPKIDLESAAKQKKPVLIVFWGFNGAGKTTSLAKTASWLKGKGYTCVFAAADTFRAGAEEQLDIHAGNIGVKSIKHKYGADPAAVIFDAVEHAKAKGVDFVLADTAGRAHTNENLMDQMKKIMRVNKPDVKILVIDSLTGNDALLQARIYGEIGVDAVIFTKVDVNEKGGAILSVTNELKKPILFLGLGQDYSNFEEFDAEKFIDRVLA